MKARRFFADQIRAAKDTIDDDSRLDEITDALLDLFKVLVIDLEENDDVQIIFEVLNGRQTPFCRPLTWSRTYCSCGPNGRRRTSRIFTTGTGQSSMTSGGKTNRRRSRC